MKDEKLADDGSAFTSSFRLSPSSLLFKSIKVEDISLMGYHGGTSIRTLSGDSSGSIIVLRPIATGIALKIVLRES